MNKSTVCIKNEKNYFICPSCGNLIEDDIDITISSNRNLILKLAARCDCNKFTSITTKNLEIAKLLQKLAKLNIFIYEFYECNKTYFIEIDNYISINDTMRYNLNLEDYLDYYDDIISKVNSDNKISLLFYYKEEKGSKEKFIKRLSEIINDIEGIKELRERGY